VQVYRNRRRSETVRAALRYTNSGVPVFPCRGKRPLTRRGHLDATTDPRRITAWFNQWPDANIGVPTGGRSGLLALDVDHPAAMDELERERGELPATRTHATGSGGIHYLFRYPAGDEIRNSAGKLAPGLDVRGEGGYIVAPPSATTRPYEVLDDLPLADPPEWLLEALRSDSRGAGVGDAHSPGPGPLDTGGPIPEGTRDDTLASIAGKMHDGSRDLDELTAGLLEINARRCEPPLPERQVEKIARSVHHRPPCKRTGPTPTPEVLEALEEIERELWRREWRGMGELSGRDVYVALIKAGRSHGELIPGGVRVSISVRALALAAAVSKRTAHYAIKRLKAAGVIRADNAGRSGTESGALVLIPPRANLHHSPTTEHLRTPEGASGATLRTPRLRWSAPVYSGLTRTGTIRRLGKGCGAVIDALEQAGGSATVEELADALHKARPRDVRRRYIARLETAGVVECSGDDVSLAAEWLDALNRERDAAGEIAAYQRDMSRYAREREAYRDHLDRLRRGVAERPDCGPTRRGMDTRRVLREAADGRIQELQSAAPVQVDGVFVHGPECACEWCFDSGSSGGIGAA
jgi:hypothetical protein